MQHGYVLLLAVCLQLAQATHILVSPSFAYPPNVVSCGLRLSQGLSCDCTRGGSVVYFMAGFNFSASSCADTTGCVSNISGATCAISTQMLYGDSSHPYPSANASWDPSNGFQCPNGFYVHGFFPTTTGNTTASAFNAIHCKSQMIQQNWADTYYEPWNMSRGTLCKTNYLMAGIRVIKQGVPGDLSDIDSIFCALPDSPVCVLPPKPIHSNLIFSPSSCATNFHLYCNYTLGCDPGYAVTTTQSIASCTFITQGTAVILNLGGANVCGNINECNSSNCAFSDSGPGPGCNTCSPNAQCTDTDPGYTCTCNPGFVGNGSSCVPRSYCDQSCTNGATPDSSSYSSCNDCPQYSNQIAGSYQAVCVQLFLNFTCACPVGFSPGNGSASYLAQNPCQPINECLLNTDNCPRGSNGNISLGWLCVDQNPSPDDPRLFQCVCARGFNGTNCTDFNECAASCTPDTMNDPLGICNNCDLTRSNCSNQIGAIAQCPCLPGYMKNSSTGICDDINECASNPCNSSLPGICVNLINKFECLPIITNVTLLGSSSNHSAPFNLTSVAQTSPDQVLLTITPPTAGISWDKTISYGTSLQARLFPAQCVNLTSTRFLCSMTAGAGANLSFALSACLIANGSSLSCPTLFTVSYPAFRFSYPPPTLNSASLCVVGGTCGTNVNVTYRGILTVNGTNFINVKGLVSVTFTSGGSIYNCAVQTVTFTSLSCIPDSVYSEFNFKLSVIVGADDTGQTVQGSDIFNFKPSSSASIVAISLANASNGGGCTVSGRMLINCPCVGGVDIVVSADQALVGPLTFTVDGVPVQQFDGFIENSTSAKCKLPGGVGDLRPVFLTTAGTKVGPVDYLISYGGPIINEIRSDGQCSPTPGNSLALANCSRSGGGYLYLIGHNFGTSGALILTNAQNIPATHLYYLDGNPSQPNGPDMYLRFPLPAGAAVQTVIVFQKNGKGSIAQVTYDYQQCPAGTYRSNLICVGCSPGKISNVLGTTACADCSTGTYQNLGNQTLCYACGPGTFNNNTGQTNCSQCGPGTLAPSFQSVACAQCPVGTYNIANSSISCTNCIAGRAGNATGLTACVACLPGTFASADQATTCAPCSAGKFITTSSATMCFTCGAGLYQDVPGQTFCKNCQSGTFTDYTTDKAGCSICPGGKYAQSNSQGCIFCDPGQYQDGNSPSTQCLNCSVGTISSSRGLSACDPCAAGRFLNMTGGTSCDACVVGSYLLAAASPKVGCVFCEPGRFSAAEGSSDCTNCLAGSYQTSYNSTICIQCDIGRFSGAPGTVNCVDCLQGEYQPVPSQPYCLSCPAGKFSAITAAIGCQLCPPGSYSAPRSLGCLVCGPGTYQPLSGQGSCLSCPNGTFNSGYNASTCQTCAAGSFAKDAGSQECTLCLPGTSSAPGQSICPRCTGGTYASNLGQVQCDQCPSDAYADSTYSSCSCPVGFYSISTPFFNGVDNATKYACKSCVTGFVCLHDGISAELLTEAPGYWRPPLSMDTTVYRCVKPSLCLGARQCTPHREGPMCALCEDGYKASGPAAACGLCSADNGQTWGYTIGIIILVVFLLCIFYYVVLKVTSSQQIKLEKLANMKDEEAIQRVEELQKQFAVDDAYFEAERAQFAAKSSDNNNNESDNTSNNTEETEEVDEEGEQNESTTNPEEDHRVTKAANDRALIAAHAVNYKNPIFATSPAGGRSSVAQIVRPGDKSLPDEFVNEKGTFKLKHYSLASRRAPNFMYKVKILVGFFQIASILPLQGDIAWPTAFSDFIMAFSVLNFDFIPWQSLTCATKITYFGRAILVGCIPIVVVIALVLFFYIPMYLRDLDSISDQLRKQHKRNSRNRQFIRLLLFTVFLLYPFVSKIVLGIYNCVTVEGVSYLAADFELLCFDARWRVYAGICALFVIMYPVGIPITYFFILRRSYADLHEPAVILQFGFLYEAYTDQRWYWELIDLVHKLILTSVVIFAPATWILGVNIFVICVYLIMILLFHPYIRKGDDRFHLLTQTELFLLALVGYVIQDKNIVFTTDPEMDGLLSACLIAIVLFLVLSFIVIAGRNVRKIWTHAKAKKRAKELQVVLAPSHEVPEESSPKTKKIRPAALEL